MSTPNSKIDPKLSDFLICRICKVPSAKTYYRTSSRR